MKSRFVYILLLFSSLLQASDFAKEQRWADEIVDSIMDGEAVWLTTGDHEFLSIYTEAEDESTQGMIVVHGTGVHPNWDQVVRPLRVGMTEKGWHTLSVQMPILQNDAEYREYTPLYPQIPARLQVAEQYLLDQGVTEIVIAAHSQGATMAAYYLAHQPSRAKAFIAIGMPAQHSDDPKAIAVSAATSLRSIRIPVLDLYGSADLPSVSESVGIRKSASIRNAAYVQQEIAGADHFFEGKDEPLLETVNRWLVY